MQAAYLTCAAKVEPCLKIGRISCVYSCKALLVLPRTLSRLTQADRRAWAAHFKATKQDVVWTDGQRGAGAPGLKSRLLKVCLCIMVAQGLGLGCLEGVLVSCASWLLRGQLTGLDCSMRV